METIDLLSGLQKYISLLTSIREEKLPDYQSSEFIQTISLSYDTITLRLDIRNNQNENKKSFSRYLQCGFLIDRQKVSLTEVSSQIEDQEKAVTDFILKKESQEGFAWDTRAKENLYNKEILRYLSIADEIAKKGYLCDAGDNYSPGYFSKIIVTDSSIVLEQVNRWNSKSLDHKKDYHMRDLEFHIPLREANENKSGLPDYLIGQMLIHFTDHSSENNKNCGDGIREKILEEKARF